MRTTIYILFSLIPYLVFAGPNDCEEGFVFDSDANRCVVQDGTSEIQGAARDCKADDPNCFKNNVTDALTNDESVPEGTNPKQDWKSWTSSSIAVAVGAYAIVRNKELKECGRTSIYMIAAGGVTTILGEQLSINKYRRTLRDLNEEYVDSFNKSANDPEDGLDLITKRQIMAFDFQIDQESAREKAHKSRKNTYNWAGGIYAGAGAVAIYEAIANGWGIGAAGKDCKPILKKNVLYTPLKERGNIEALIAANHSIFGEFHFLKNLSKEEIIEATVRKFVNVLFPSAYAVGPGVNGNMLDEVVVEGRKVEKAISEIKPLGIKEFKPDFGEMKLIERIPTQVQEPTNKLMDQMVGSPIFRIALSGLLSWYSFDAAKEAKGLEEDASKRVEAIKEYKAGFIAAGGVTGMAVCTSKDRNKPSKPECYCFNSDGSKNTNRINNSACSFYKDKTLLSANDYDRNNSGYGYVAPKGCLNTDGTLNPTCDCTKNQCSTMSGKLNLGTLANLAPMNSMLRATKKFQDGQLSTDDLNGGTADKLAINLKNMKDKLAKAPESSKYMDQVGKLQEKMKKGFANIMSNAAKNGALSPALASSGLLGSDSAPKSAAEIIKATESQFKKNTDGTLSIKPINSTAGVSESDFNFGDDSRGGVEVAGENSEIMNKEFKVDDISNNMDGNIFKMINNRYQLSGMKRLFEEPANEN